MEHKRKQEEEERKKREEDERILHVLNIYLVNSFLF